MLSWKFLEFTIEILRTDTSDQQSLLKLTLFSKHWCFPPQINLSFLSLEKESGVCFNIIFFACSQERYLISKPGVVEGYLYFLDLLDMKMIVYFVLSVS